MTQHNSFSPKNREDDLLKSALSNIDEVQNSQGESTTNYVTGGVLKSKSSKLKKTLIIALVLVISSLAIGFGYWLLQKDKNTQSSNQNNSDQQNSKKVSEQTVKLGFDPDLVAYLHRDNQADPNQLFYRPANGGERKDVLKLQNDESAVVSDVYGQIVVLASESKLYLSNDGGRNYNVIYTHDTSDSIISAKISTDLSKIAFSTIPSIEGVAGSSYYGTIYSINIKGEDKKQLIQSSDKALLLLGWDSKQNKIAYSEGCYNCDGSRTAYKLYSINSTNTEGILTDKDLATVQYLQISRDLSKVIYVTSSSPTSFEPSPPYQVRVINLNDNKDSLVQTVGTKGQQNANGTAYSWSFVLGFYDGSNTPYYVVDNSLYGVKDGQSSLLLESEDLISDVYYLNENQAIYLSRKSQNEQVVFLNNYNFTNKTTTQILEGDYNTLIFGVSTK